ncbi:C4b-binding protein alpha chain-like [Tachyglossus aculeatus]|uniref:C4b-binding protein alpha chain-like n=1 Tax=Tachyglossus aculeatus TaxID=9261 RepID=UPI0018F3D721|nr:C4b-binding protein alpha chain-like [Tachyglossus aculeatus]XP_038605720.1 C4b-binding protein alpha chain-like [Tachyglossus aculeatus]XP_038605721.1 C4b-binding protein alpha chain-like [Tachyglossus aculeatus]
MTCRRRHLEAWSSLGLGRLGPSVLLSLGFILPALVASVPGNCRPPPELRTVQLLEQFRNKKTFSWKESVSYECRPGYSVNQHEIRHANCRSTGTWSLVEEYCTQMSCPDPGEFANGRFFQTDGNLFGSEMSFVCDEGFQLIGSSTSQCKVVPLQKTVHWSPEQPQCVVSCAKPVVSNGSPTTISSHYTPRDTVTIQCNPGFHLTGPQTVTCSERGSWEPELPTCKKEFLSCQSLQLGGDILKCDPDRQRVKTALEVYKMSLEIEKLELELESMKKNHVKGHVSAEIPDPERDRPIKQ